ncbi:MAG: hypothetical protein IJA94_06445 [Bacilli bacterium]|nr:hypothetical protein [Bacilli bacterium]
MFDKNDKEKIHDCWNCNGFCCKADLCNGLWCEDYGINFNKNETDNFIKEYVKNGVEGTYGYLKEVEVDLEEDLWNDIEKDLKNNYKYDDNDIKIKGFIPYEYSDVLEEYSSYWEQPDVSYLKQNYKILKDVVDVKKQEELDPEIIRWVSKDLYNEQIEEIQM